MVEKRKNKKFKKLNLDMLQIPVRMYNQIVPLGTATRVNQLSNALANAINRSINLMNLGQVNINLPTLELINLGYTEKQITGIEGDVIYYDRGMRLSLRSLLYHHHFTSSYPILLSKYFSGDLSGVISESVFVYYLTHNVGIPPYEIAHLRPYKVKNWLSPDFLFYDHQKRLSSIFGTKAYSTEIYAEVKGCMGDIDSKRIEKALKQLSRLVKSSNQFGILFVLNRPKMGNYRATLVVVRG